MQYRVPQHIDQEDKIFGPLTFIQLIYALIGGALLLVLFVTLPLPLFILLAIPVLTLTIAFSLIKVQDQPFSRFFVSLLVYLKQPKHRIWQDLDNPVGSDGLGMDFKDDVTRDKPNAPAVLTPAPTPSPEAARPLIIQQSDTATSIPITPPNQPDSFDQMAGIAPPKPANRLTVQTVKGGS